MADVLSTKDGDLPGVRLPNLTVELVEALERFFPDRCPDPEKTDRDVHMIMGEQKVVRFIRAEFEAQLSQSITETF